MFSKTFDILKRNPIIIIFYLIYSAAAFGLMLPIISGGYNTNDLNEVVTFLLKMAVIYLFMAVFALIFFSGFGQMLAESAVTGTTSASSFIPGLKKYFVRVLLSALLLFAFYIGFCIVLGIMMIPITILIGVMGTNMSDPVALTSLVTSITLGITGLILIFSAPFILLWYPAIFIDNIGVLEGLGRGARASVKNYWKLVLLLIIMFIPTAIYFAVSFPANMKGYTMTPGYVVMYVMCIILSIFLLTATHVIYNDCKEIGLFDV